MMIQALTPVTSKNPPWTLTKATAPTLSFSLVSLLLVFSVEWLVTTLRLWGLWFCSWLQNVLSWMGKSSLRRCAMLRVPEGAKGGRAAHLSGPSGHMRGFPSAARIRRDMLPKTSVQLDFSHCLVSCCFLSVWQLNFTLQELELYPVSGSQFECRWLEERENRTGWLLVLLNRQKKHIFR